MDGRRFQLWLGCGLLLIAVGCHKQHTHPSTNALNGLAGDNKPSLFARFQSEWNRTSPPQTSDSDPGLLSSQSKKKDWSPDSIVAFADLRFEYAYTEEKPEGERERLVDSARMAYQAALRKDPKHPGAMLGLAKLYARIGEMAKANEMYRQYFALHPKDHVRMSEAAMAHARAKDFNGAVAWLEQALKIDPENRGYRKTLGFCLVHAGRWEQGYAVLSTVMSEAEARYTLARAFMTMNQTDQSRQQLELAVQADPGFAPARQLLTEMGQTSMVKKSESQDPILTIDYQLQQR